MEHSVDIPRHRLKELLFSMEKEEVLVHLRAPRIRAFLAKWGYEIDDYGIQTLLAYSKWQARWEAQDLHREE